eukprot:gnl/MRDRNA2_/MRDRNA2_75125_c0_seq1.p1 gnl/MRDRNA2_/MRDRNA2_75125_c0~~gnl/MRDRNA2_/MRDRNA2_75125_c0_seq1.p1  ORF type:complete len:410 (-),score=65.37 gnl/MRDRNA2_/MRDRNA2_75125_c0_seq1:36-1265(-)
MPASVFVILCCFMCGTALKVNQPPWQMSFEREQISAMKDKTKPKQTKQDTFEYNPLDDVNPRCHVPDDFKRNTNPNAIRQPTQEQTSQADFYDEPHIAKLFYINLDVSSDRRKIMENMLAELGNERLPYERWKATTVEEAMKKTKHHLHEFSELGLAEHVDEPRKMGTQAIYYSHHQLLTHISLQELSENFDPNAVYIILEDDVALGADTMKEVRCQLKMLPPDWDVFKFGYVGLYMEQSEHGSEHPSKKKWQYPECPDFGHNINNHTCYQADWNWNYMGNQAYAVRPQGAKRVIEHLRKRPIMDFDGALMPLAQDLEIGGWSTLKGWKKPGLALWLNTYVSKRNFVQHLGYKLDRFKSDRLQFQKIGKGNKYSHEDANFVRPIMESKDQHDDYPDEYSDFLQPGYDYA